MIAALIIFLYSLKIKPLTVSNNTCSFRPGIFIYVRESFLSNHALWPAQFAFIVGWAQTAIIWYIKRFTTRLNWSLTREFRTKWCPLVLSNDLFYSEGRRFFPNIKQKRHSEDVEFCNHQVPRFYINITRISCQDLGLWV